MQYENMFKNEAQGARIETVKEDIQSYYLRLAETLIVRMNAQYLAAASIGKYENGTLIAWFNGQPLHTAPLSLNLLHNALFRAMIGEEYSVKVTNYPMPFTTKSRMQMLAGGNNLGFQLATNVGFAMAFVSAFYVMFYIKERESKAKLLQFVSGVNVFTFWITSFIWDYFTFFLTAVLMVVTIGIFREEGWSTAPELGRAAVIFLLFGFGALPMTFIASLVFNVPSSGFTRMTTINIFTGNK